MVKWEININQENCTGCLICQMICSWANEGGFHPYNSSIKVEYDYKGSHFSIRIADSCNNCGLCASYCTSKALVKEKRQLR